MIDDRAGFGSAVTVLTNAGHTVTVRNNEFANNYGNLLDAAFLQGFEFIVYAERGNGNGGVLPANVAASLDQYVLGGGNLLVTGYDSLASPVDANLAGLLRVTNVSDAAAVNGNPNWLTANINHFILNGPHGDFRNLSFSATSYDIDRFTPDPSALILASMGAGTNDGVTRIMFLDLPGAGGSVGYWNGGFLNQLNAQPDFSDGANPQRIFLNWAAGVGATSAVPEPSTYFISAAGLAILLLRQRRQNL